MTRRLKIYETLGRRKEAILGEYNNVARSKEIVNIDKRATILTLIVVCVRATSNSWPAYTLYIYSVRNCVQM